MHRMERIVLASTTAVVVLVGAATLRLAVEAREPSFDLALAVAAVAYVGILARGLAARRGTEARPPAVYPVAPFAVAGVVTGALLRLVVGAYRVDRDILVAAAAGLVVGIAHATAVTVWLRLRSAARPEPR